MMLFHHSRELAHVRHGPVGPGGDPADELEAQFHAAYAWLAGRLGFRPVFLAVGATDEDRRMTGYQDQWRRKGTRRASRALFSWAQAPPGAVLMDFTVWHVVLNSVEREPGDPHALRVAPIGRSNEQQLWKRSWTPADWMRAARRGTASVQAVVPALDLSTADEIWCRNREDRQALIALGFDAARVRARRLRVG